MVSLFPQELVVLALAASFLFRIPGALCFSSPTRVASRSFFRDTTTQHQLPRVSRLWSLSTSGLILLSDLETPSLVLELDLLERKRENGVPTTEDILSNIENSHLLQDCLFIHTKVISTKLRDTFVEENGSGKSLYIAQVDASFLIQSACYLGIGLANHHVGGYYWARGMGIGASLPAHGVEFGTWDDYQQSCAEIASQQQPIPPSTETSSFLTAAKDATGGHLYWKTRGPGEDAKAPTEESSNSNDGKRSEWADFLRVGDTVQLVPLEPHTVLRAADYTTMYGVRRSNRPKGADPLVEAVWTREGGSWKLLKG